MEYESPDAMPADVRDLYDKVMKTAEAGSGAGVAGLVAEQTGIPAGHTPLKQESSFSPRSFLAAIGLIGLLLLLYFLYQSVK